MKEVSISTIYGYIAPYAAPVPSAYVLGVNVYHSILVVSGPDYWWLAALAALIGMVGIESTGGLSAILVSRAFVRRNWSIMSMAIVAVAAYAGFVAWGIYSSNDSKPMITTVAITLLAYFVVALAEGMKTVERMQTDNGAFALQAAQTEAIKLHAEVERLNAERLLTNSRARLEKASSGQRPVSSGQTGQQNGQVGQYDQAVLDAVVALLQANPMASTREIAAAGVGIKSPQTALKYRTLALDIIAKQQVQP